MSYYDTAVKYGTDKATHGYMPYYEQKFKALPDFIQKRMRMLEIGCKEGASLRMWRELYPKAKLLTLDLFQEFPIPDIALIDGEITAVRGDQTVPYVLDTLRKLGPYDIIIDDGSHNSRDQLITFYGLLGNCYLYVVEDLHCCNDPFYQQGMRWDQTMLGQMKTGTFPFHFELFEDKIAFIYA